MSAELQRLIYASRWAGNVADDIDETVRSIVCASIPKNRLANLTGLLMVNNGWFIQALEGSRPNIAALMDRLFRDPRHSDIHVICSGSTDGRCFADWNMAAVTMGAETRNFLSELGITSFDGRRLDAGSALNLMQAIGEAERQRERAALRLSAA